MKTAMRTQGLILVGVLLGSSGPALAGDALDLRLARQYFDEAQTLWNRDGGRLWGRPLNGPLLFVDRGTRRVAANQADAEGRLRADGSLFVGELPAGVPAANTSTTWAGVRWIMVLWPLPRDPAQRRVLLMHESWHRVQKDLGLPPTGPANAHLDTLEGRYWLQLEWRALARALSERGDERRAAVGDALRFRIYRQQQFKQAAKEEALLEMHEGLAEYTGVKLSGLSDAEQRAYVVQRLNQRPRSMPTFVRSFAYLSGPAYGLLLDEATRDWRKELRSDADLAALLRKALALLRPAPVRDELEARAKKYSGESLWAAEKKRDQERKKRIADYEARFVRGPVLVLPLQEMQFSFDPGALQPLPGIGTVYPSLRMMDRWGVLTVSKGALIADGFKTARVSAPADPKARPLRGDGWELELKPGWRVERGERRGDYRLEYLLRR